MPTYILLSSLTAEGRRTVKENPKRILEVNKEISAMGGRVISQFAVLGPYDFVNILEAPDNETVTRISVEMGSRGTINMISMPALSVEKFISAVKKRKGSRRKKK